MGDSADGEKPGMMRCDRHAQSTHDFAKFESVPKISGAATLAMVLALDPSKAFIFVPASEILRSNRRQALQRMALAGLLLSSSGLQLPRAPSWALVLPSRSRDRKGSRGAIPDQNWFKLAHAGPTLPLLAADRQPGLIRTNP